MENQLLPVSREKINQFSGRWRLLLRVVRCPPRCWDLIEGGRCAISEDRLDFGDEVSAKFLSNHPQSTLDQRVDAYEHLNKSERHQESLDTERKKFVNSKKVACYTSKKRVDNRWLENWSKKIQERHAIVLLEQGWIDQGWKGRAGGGNLNELKNRANSQLNNMYDKSLWYYRHLELMHYSFIPRILKYGFASAILHGYETIAVQLEPKKRMLEYLSTRWSVLGFLSSKPGHEDCLQIYII